MDPGLDRKKRALEAFDKAVLHWETLGEIDTWFESRDMVPDLLREAMEKLGEEIG